MDPDLESAAVDGWIPICEDEAAGKADEEAMEQGMVESHLEDENVTAILEPEVAAFELVEKVGHVPEKSC